jgi:hypothetical protein
MDFESWLTGFTDGEGSFIIGISQEKGRVKPRVRPIFEISNQDLTILEKIKDYFGFGSIREGKNGVYDFYTKNIEEAAKIADFFRKNPLIVKTKEFEAWCRVLDLIRQKKHLSEEGIKLIDSIRPKNLHPRSLKRHPRKEYKMSNVCPVCGKRIVRGHHH